MIRDSFEYIWYEYDFFLRILSDIISLPAAKFASAGPIMRLMSSHLQFRSDHEYTSERLFLWLCYLKTPQSDTILATTCCYYSYMHPRAYPVPLGIDFTTFPWLSRGSLGVSRERFLGIMRSSSCPRLKYWRQPTSLHPSHRLLKWYLAETREKLIFRVGLMSLVPIYGRHWGRFGGADREKPWSISCLSDE
jgi:hypothetical protein